MKKALTLIAVILLGTSFGGELDYLIEFALKNNPRLKSYENLKASFKYRAKFSQSLPNPQIALALNNLDTKKYFPNKEDPMSSFEIHLSQEYVLPIKRERSSQIFLQKSAEVDAMQERFKKELVKKLKVLYWEFAYSFEMERILRETGREIRSLIKITEEKYRYGKALLSDLLLLRVELLKVEEMLAKARRIRETSLERIHALAGGKLDLRGSDLIVLDFPKEFVVERNVDVKLMKEELKTIKRELDRVMVEHYPDLFLSAEYAVRPDIPNLITLRVGITLPVWKKKREDMLVMEKRELYNSKLLELEDTKLQVSGEFGALKDSYRISSEVLSTVEKEIEEKRKEIDALLIAYKYDRTDIREILRAYESLWSLEFYRAELIKELNQIVAEAEALQ